MYAPSAGGVIHSTEAAAGPHGASNRFSVPSGAVDKPVETVDSPGIAALTQRRRGTACHNKAAVKAVNTRSAPPSNAVEISVRTALALTFEKSNELISGPGHFATSDRPITTADNRRSVSEEFASLPHVALLARLVR